MIGAELPRLVTLAVLGALACCVCCAEDGGGQRPLADDAFAGLTSPPQGTKHHYNPGLNTSITLHSDTKWFCSPLKHSRRVDITTRQDICLSANFTLDNNVILKHPGICPGGGTPYLALYPSNDCTGPYSHIDWYDPGPRGLPRSHTNPPRCISPAAFGKTIAPPAGQWSIIFRCETDRESDGAATSRAIFFPAPPPPPPPKPKKPEPSHATVSDSACYVSSLGPPRFLFQHPEADTCLAIEPRQKLKIYRTATCTNGTEALFARYAGDRCRGEPVMLREVTADMLATNSPATCIDMSEDEWVSYAFWCTGEVKWPKKPLSKDLFPEKGDGNSRVHYCWGDACDRLERPRKRGMSMWIEDFGVRKLLLIMVLCALGVGVLARYGRKLGSWIKVSLFLREVFTAIWLTKF